MMIIERTTTFKRNYKALKKKNYDMKKMETVLSHLVNQDIEILKSKYKDYSLKNNVSGKY